MEADAFITWGITISLQERFLSQSDGTINHFCKVRFWAFQVAPKHRAGADGSLARQVCGLPATEKPPSAGQRLTRKTCLSCASKAAEQGVPYAPSIASVYMSRASFLALLTWLAMGIAVRPRFV